MKIKRIHVLLVLLLLACCLIPFRWQYRATVENALRMRKGQKTVAQRVAEYSEVVRGRLLPRFQQIGVSYPPAKIALLGFKQENIMEVWVSNGRAEFRHLITYPVRGASGELGPKLMEGDRQMPEGLYDIESLNPNSSFHLALRVNYPNRFDKAKGREDGRTELGSDIMIHGGATSIGCFAMGDEAAEDLFVLAAQTGIQNIAVVLSPVDFRVRNLPANMPKLPQWGSALYAAIQQELRKYKQ